MKIFTLLIALFASASVLAHHNYRLRFDYDIDVEMNVTVTKFDWKNPHIEILVDVENDDGTLTSWVMPTMAPGVANRLGITPETLQPGDVITVTGAQRHERASRTHDDARRRYLLHPLPPGLSSERWWSGRNGYGDGQLDRIR